MNILKKDDAAIIQAEKEKEDPTKKDNSINMQKKDETSSIQTGNVKLESANAEQDDPKDKTASNETNTQKVESMNAQQEMHKDDFSKPQLESTKIESTKEHTEVCSNIQTENVKEVPTKIESNIIENNNLIPEEKHVIVQQEINKEETTNTILEIKNLEAPSVQSDIPEAAKVETSKESKNCIQEVTQTNIKKKVEIEEPSTKQKETPKEEPIIVQQEIHKEEIKGNLQELEKHENQQAEIKKEEETKNVIISEEGQIIIEVKKEEQLSQEAHEEEQPKVELENMKEQLIQNEVVKQENEKAISKSEAQPEIQQVNEKPELTEKPKQIANLLRKPTDSSIKTPEFSPVLKNNAESATQIEGEQDSTSPEQKAMCSCIIL